MKKRLFLLVFVFLLSVLVNLYSVNAAEGDEVWNKSFAIGGIAHSVAIDSDSVYVAGFDYIAMEYKWRVFKLNSSNGNEQWNKSFSWSIEYEEARSVAVDSSGYIYVAGFDGAADTDWRILKLNSSGDEQWNKSFDWSTSDYAHSVAVDSSGYIYIVGYDYASGNPDWRILKLDSSGDEQWNKSFNWSTGDYAHSVAVDSSGYIYVVGYDYASGNPDWRILKLDSSGDEQWNKSFNWSTGDVAYSVAVDSGYIYVVGYDKVGNKYNWRILKLNSSGDEQWNKSFNWSTDNTAYSIAYKSNYTYVVGKDYGGGIYNWRILKMQAAQLAPTLSTDYFSGGETTDVSAITDYSDVPDFTLDKTDTGKIKWSDNINIDNADINTNVKIGVSFVAVNTAALHSTLNSNAAITIRDVTCPVSVISHAPGFHTTRAAIQANGEDCEKAGVCSNKQCSGSTLTFTASHCSGFAVGANANLTIYDEFEDTSTTTGTNITFYANYTNASAHISGASCNITFDDNPGTWYVMTENPGVNYNYTKSGGFSTDGTRVWNVTCDKAGYTKLTINDTVVVTAVAAPIPEFSTITALLALVIVIGGFFIMRRKTI